MTRKRNPEDDKGLQVPAYIVTYSDMVTLLLTFFVMLLSLSTVQDPEMFHKGRDSFIDSIKKFGIGILFGKDLRPDFGHSLVLHPVDNPDAPPQTRTVDATDEDIRKMFKELLSVMTARPSPIVADTTRLSLTDIHFPPGGSELDESARLFLTELARNLNQSPNSAKTRVCVLGLARDAAGEKEQWLLSARRAQAVADFLNEAAQSEFQLPAYSWGAGPGGDWVGRGSPVSEHVQIMVAMLMVND